MGPGRNMRRTADIGQGVEGEGRGCQLRFRTRIVIPDIQHGTAQAPVAQGLVERRLIDNVRPPDIDQHGAGLHCGQLAFADHAPCPGGERAAQQQEVDIGQQFMQCGYGMCRIGPGFPSPVARDGRDLHVERAQAPRRGAPYPAEADDGDMGACRLIVKRALAVGPGPVRRIHGCRPGKAEDLMLEDGVGHVFRDGGLVLIYVAHQAVRGQGVPGNGVQAGAGRVQQARLQARGLIGRQARGDEHIGDDGAGCRQLCESAHGVRRPQQGLQERGVRAVLGGDGDVHGGIFM